LPAPNTTPESLDLQAMLAEVRDLGGTHAVMEVSSHALALDRVYGAPFRVAVFTNLTQDHLDFHGNMESYLAARDVCLRSWHASAGLLRAECRRSALRVVRELRQSEGDHLRDRQTG